ncbi:MAG: cysteine--tRNA ligase [Tissierellia bacterium]|nr:cysteine--tRNA ligase [Tissierellia bacterium]
MDSNNKSLLGKTIAGNDEFKVTDISSFIKEQDLKFCIYNTKSRKVEEIVPVTPGKIGLYACGPTVYKYAHIGNLRTYISEDILKRVLMMYGYKVKHIMNVTDVGHLVSDADEGEDKMEKSAKEMNMDAWEIAKYYFDEFRRDMKYLNITEPTIFTPATGHIDEQIQLVKRLEEKGYTYKTSDGVYFDTSKFPKYADFGQIDVEGLQSGARIGVNDEKKNITDFALWKFSKDGENRQMEWPSPWGIGFPGWHIECSAMAIKYLGEYVDIHCGGSEHVKVHHTNEIAQSESYLEHEWVNYWFHTDWLILEGNEKMSKSSDNYLTINSLIEKGYDPIVYRYYCLNAGYNKQLVFKWEGMDSAKTSLSRLYKKVLELKKSANADGKFNEKYTLQFFTSLFDDLNVSKSLGLLWNMLSDSEVNDRDKYRTVLLFDEILGLNLSDVKEEVKEITEEVKIIIAQRDEARRNKDYKMSDELRNKLVSLGYKVLDTKEGTKIE